MTDAPSADVSNVNDQISDATPAASSSAPEGVNSYEAAFDAALGGKEAAPAPVEPGANAPEPEPIPEDDELSEEESKLFSERSQQRFRALANAKKEVQAKATELETRLSEVEPKLKRFEELSGYMQQHRIGDEHLNNALSLTAMINGRDERAVPILRQLLTQLETEVGERLPQDLQEQVSLGYITEAHARELTKAKKQAELARATVQDREQQAARQEQHQVVDRATQSAERWNLEQATSDPDWNQKAPLVTQALQLALLQGGPDNYPRSEKDVRTLLDRLKKEVDATVGKFRPAPKPITPATNGNAPSPRSSAKPTSYEEAVELALAGKSG